MKTDKRDTIRDLMEDFDLTGEEILEQIQHEDETVHAQVDGYLRNIDELRDRAVGLATGDKSNIMAGINGLETNYLFSGQCLTSAGYTAESQVEELCDILGLPSTEIDDQYINGVYENVKKALEYLSINCENFTLCGKVHFFRQQLRELDHANQKDTVFEVEKAITITKILLGIAKLYDANVKKRLRNLEIRNLQDKTTYLEGAVEQLTKNLAKQKKQINNRVIKKASKKKVKS